MQTFPNIASAQHWYVTTKDGLIGLRTAANHEARLSDTTLDQLWGMTESEWHQFYRQQVARHEMFATLALFAACEGGIRRDFEWRCLSNHGLAYRQKFTKLKHAATRKHIPLHAILETWQSADTHKKWFANQIATLKTLFEQRNALAHGTAYANVAFELVFDRLDTIRQKWMDMANDFRGY